MRWILALNQSLTKNDIDLLRDGLQKSVAWKVASKERAPVFLPVLFRTHSGLTKSMTKWGREGWRQCLGLGTRTGRSRWRSKFSIHGWPPIPWPASGFAVNSENSNRFDTKTSCDSTNPGSRTTAAILQWT